jgi:hypothetical protein
MNYPMLHKQMPIKDEKNVDHVHTTFPKKYNYKNHGLFTQATWTPKLSKWMFAMTKFKNQLVLYI